MFYCLYVVGYGIRKRGCYKYSRLDRYSFDDFGRGFD